MYLFVGGVTFIPEFSHSIRIVEVENVGDDDDAHDKYFVMVRFAAKWHSSHKFMVHIDPDTHPIPSQVSQHTPPPPTTPIIIIIKTSCTRIMHFDIFYISSSLHLLVPGQQLSA